MISDTRVRALARQDGVTAGLAEKDYVNSWVLYAIASSPLGESLVFKGGTALSKLYFPDIWRFSEDLDFTATEALPDIERTLDSALTDIEAESGINFEIRNMHTAGDPVEYVQFDVQYDAVLGQKNTTDLDITFNEPLMFPIVDHDHAFEDSPRSVYRRIVSRKSSWRSYGACISGRGLETTTTSTGCWSRNRLTTKKSSRPSGRKHAPTMWRLPRRRERPKTMWRPSGRTGSRR